MYIGSMQDEVATFIHPTDFAPDIGAFASTIL